MMEVEKPLHAGQSLEVEEDVEDDDKGPAVLYSEFEKALEELKNKKAPGPDKHTSRTPKGFRFCGEKGAIRNM